MSLFNRALNLVGLQKIENSSPGPLSDFWWRDPQTGFVTVLNGFVSPLMAQQLAVVDKCIRTLAYTVGSVPLILYRRLPNGGKKRAVDHPLFKILHDKPNKLQTVFEWKESMQGHFESSGNGYSEILFDRMGEVDQLKPIHPDNVGDIQMNDRGNLVYPIRENGSMRNILGENMFHLRGPIEDGFKGFSPLRRHAKSVGVAISTDDFAGRYFSNSARPGGVLVTPKKFKDKEERDNYTDSWQRSQSGANAHRTAMLENGMEYKEFTIKPEEAQFLETRKYQNVDIGTRVYDLPPHVYGEMDKATFSNIEQQALEFIAHTMLARFVRFEQRANRDLLGDDSGEFFFEFLIDALLRGDAIGRATSNQIQFMNGAMNQDEWRAMENRNPLPNKEGQKFYVPMNLRAVGEPILDENNTESNQDEL